MKTKTYITFDGPGERAILNEALISHRIAFEGDVTEDQLKQARALSHISKGSDTSLQLLERARTLVARLLHLCEVQSEERYWLEQGVPDGKTPFAGDPEQAGAVGLIAPGTDAVGILVESRRLQARAAQDALNLIDQGISQIPAYERLAEEEEA